MSENLQRGASQGGFRTVSEEGVNPTTDGSGDITHTFGDLRKIESKGDVDVSAEGGFVANVTSISTNTVTVRVFESAGSAAEMAAATSQSVVLNFQARGY